MLNNFAAEELDLVGIGSMVAATGNDQVNTLACVSLGHTLGISHVFQIKPEDVEESERKSSSTEYNGRLIGNTSLTAAEFEKQKKAGAVVKCTSLNESFTIESFEKLYGDSATILFRITPSGGLIVVTPGSTAPSAGDQLISLVIEPETDDGYEPVKVEPAESEGPINLP